MGQSDREQVGYHSGHPEDMLAEIRLLVLNQMAWTQVDEDPAAFAAEHMLTLGAGPDLLRSVGQQTVALSQPAQLRLGLGIWPWIAERTSSSGTCSFTAPPDADGVVEIASFTFPPCEGRGYATAMAARLVGVAQGAGIRKVRAHTLPEPNASTRILEKLGFERIGEAVNPNVGPVSCWERDCHLPSNCL